MAAEKRRRQYKTGSIHKRGDGRWAGSFEDGYTATGKRKRVTVYGKTEAEVRVKLTERKRQDAAEGSSVKSVRTTVKTWAEEWLAITERTLRPKTWATNRSAVNRWITPTIGHRRLEQLTPADIRSVAAAQRAAGRSTSTAHRTQVVLLVMLKAALLEGHRVPRRVLDVSPPALAVNDRTAMPIGHSLQLLQAASYLPHGSRWAMALLHGMRQAECLGLTWDAILFDRGYLIVEWQLQPLPYLDKADRSAGFRIPDGYEARQLVKAQHLVRPKTKAGFRVVPLEPAMMEALRDWKEVAPPNPWGLVWTDARGLPISDKVDRSEFYALQEAAGVAHPAGRPYLVHETRHTTATELLELGADPHQVTALMGQSSIMTTRGYQHPSQRAGLDVLTSLAARFNMKPRELG